MGMTMVEKTLAKAIGRNAVKVGDVVEPKVDLAMSHENGALVLNQFLEIYKDTGLEAKIWDPSKLAIIFDHRVPAESSKTATNQKLLRDFVAERGIHREILLLHSSGRQPAPSSRRDLTNHFARSPAWKQRGVAGHTRQSWIDLLA